MCQSSTVSIWADSVEAKLVVWGAKAQIMDQ